jgi:dephospho-CoA kinase
MKIFGLVGTAGSGKDTVAEIICDLFSMHHYNTSDFVRAVTRFIFDLPQENSPIRDQLYIVANELRALNQATTVQMGIVQAEQRGFELQLITGLRSAGEADAIRAAGGVIIAVDADPKVRYERITGRLRDAESKRTLDEFLIQDDKENQGLSPTGPSRGIRAIINEAEVKLTNESTMEALKTEIRSKISPLL